MSSEPLLLVEVAQWADATITKTETESLYEKLSVALLKAKEELSNPEKRWENLKVQRAILQDSYNKEEEYSLFLASHHPSTLIK